MSRSRAIVLTYPGHFLLTKLTVESLSKWLPEASEILIIADDVSELAWPTYIQDCKQLYQLPVIPVNLLPAASIRNGWIRQQMVKLCLDKTVNWSEFFFTDGDVVFQSDVPYQCTPFTRADIQGVPLSQRDPLPGEITSQQSFYISKMLGIEHTGIMVNNERVCVSNPPFRDIQASELSQLRSYVESIIQKDFVQAHIKIELDHRISVCEWELLAWFKQQVLGQTLDLVNMFCNRIGSTTGDPDFGRYKFSTTWGYDKKLTQQWWDSQGVTVDTDLWAMLPDTR